VPRPPRRVLLVINALIHGGAEVQLMHLAIGLAQSGHEITVCCIDKAYIDLEPLERAGVEVVSLQAEKRLQRIAALPRLARLARRSEIVHCTIWDASLWGRIAAILAHRPVVVADHSTDRSIHTSASGASRASWIALHNRLLDPFTYATVSCAGGQREVLLGEGVSAGKIVYIPNGIPLAELESAAAGGASRADLGLSPEAPLIMQVGVFREEKNQLGALDVVAAARASGADAQLVFVGDGPTRQRVEARAAEIGASWAHFLGFRSDVPALLSLADVMLQPSLADAMPMTVIEAMALGVPVLATDVGDVCSMLDGRGGLCVPAGDEGAMAQACTELLADPDRRRAMGLAGREVAAAFDSASMVRSYELLFQAACDGKSPTKALPDGDRATPLAT
jgi:glycosyltransferase involved in cell wall biosynthesis